MELPALSSRIAGLLGRFAPALALWLAIPSVAQAAPSCTPDGLVCVEAQPRGDAVEVWAESRRPCSVTITLTYSPRAEGPVHTITDHLQPGPYRKRVAVHPLLLNGQPTDTHFHFYCQCGRSDAKPDDAYLYGIPLPRGLAARVSQGFHGKFSHNNAANEYAVDFEIPENTPVHAARDGLVAEVIQGFHRGGPGESEEGANVIRVEHADHSVGEYAHLRMNGAAVRPGQSVTKGELLGYSGNTGRTTGPHLHFAVHVPINGQVRRSIPVRFQTEEPGAQELVQGKDVRRP